MTRKYPTTASNRGAARSTDLRESIRFRHRASIQDAHLSDADFGYAATIEHEVITLRDVEPDCSNLSTGKARPSTEATPQFDSPPTAQPHNHHEPVLPHPGVQAQAPSGVLDVIGLVFADTNESSDSEVDLLADTQANSPTILDPDDIPSELIGSPDPPTSGFIDIADLVIADDSDGDALVLPAEEGEDEDGHEDEDGEDFGNLDFEFLDLADSEARDYEPTLDDFVALQQDEDPWPLGPQTSLLGVTREQRAQQIAQSFAQEYGWDREGVRLLTSIFIKNSWNNMAQSAMRRLLDAGITTQELELADQVRDVWQSHQEFGEFLHYDGTITHRFSILTWRIAFDLIRAYRSYPDIEEIEVYLFNAFRTWSGHESWAGIDDPQQQFPAFYYFLCHVLNAQADSETLPPFNDF